MNWKYVLLSCICLRVILKKINQKLQPKNQPMTEFFHKRFHTNNPIPLHHFNVYISEIENTFMNKLKYDNDYNLKIYVSLGVTRFYDSFIIYTPGHVLDEKHIIRYSTKASTFDRDFSHVFDLWEVINDYRCSKIISYYNHMEMYVKLPKQTLSDFKEYCKTFDCKYVYLNKTYLDQILSILQS